MHDSNCSLTISLDIEVVELKQVSCVPILSRTINNSNTDKIKYCCYSIPSKYLWENLREFSYGFDEDVVCKRHKEKYESVDKHSNQNNGDFLHDVIRSILKLNFVPGDVKLSHTDLKNVDPDVLREEMHIHSHPKTHDRYKQSDLKLDCCKV